MNILAIMFLGAVLICPSRVFADEKTLGGHLEYHSADNQFTLAHFSWGRLSYDDNGDHRKAATLTEEQTKNIVKLGSEFQKIYGDKEHEELHKDYKGAIIIFSFKPPEAKETFTARITEDEKDNWEAINKLRKYLDALSFADNPNKKQNKAEIATPRKPSD